MIKENQLNKGIYKEKQGRIINISIKVVVGLLFMFILCGCSKKSLSPTEFSRKMKKQKYTVTDLSNKENKVILASKDNYSIYYYQFDSDELLKKTLEHELTLLKEANNDVKETTTDNSEVYVIESNGFYIVYSRIDNTYVYISAPEKYKDDVNKILKNIGY